MPDEVLVLVLLSNQTQGYTAKQEPDAQPILIFPEPQQLLVFGFLTAQWKILVGVLRSIRLAGGITCRGDSFVQIVRSQRCTVELYGGTVGFKVVAGSVNAGLVVQGIFDGLLAHAAVDANP